MKVSIVFPSYNEIENIRKNVLSQVFEYLSTVTWDYEVIFADDGSTDGTVRELLKIAKEHKKVRVLALHHRGKGPTVLEALQQATGDVRLFSDFDQATPLAEIEKLLSAVESGADIAVGSRELTGSERKDEPFHRHLMGKGFNFFVNLIALRGIHDTQCGFKLFTKNACNILLSKVYVYAGKGKMAGAFTGAFDVELLYLARKYGLRIVEMPIAWTYAKTNRVDPVKDSLRMLVDIMRVRFADLAGKYPKRMYD